MKENFRDVLIVTVSAKKCLQGNNTSKCSWMHQDSRNPRTVSFTNNFWYTVYINRLYVAIHGHSFLNWTATGVKNAIVFYYIHVILCTIFNVSNISPLYIAGVILRGAVRGICPPWLWLVPLGILFWQWIIPHSKLSKSYLHHNKNYCIIVIYVRLSKLSVNKLLLQYLKTRHCKYYTLYNHYL